LPHEAEQDLPTICGNWDLPLLVALATSDGEKEILEVHTPTLEPQALTETQSRIENQAHRGVDPSLMA
jgi:hypothetical protein